ncbi:hypothetical protein [Clostridium beijerinckii]|uniref:hypothetical protein n=1 Tax=Clostridium beijerinckii TaxID=1520 RepID=UPI00156D67A4|nr:hypothetical protein [Clostridium beijerinckii]NRT72684.1 hypothetical protein [Clostridium beijerinckii]
MAIKNIEIQDGTGNIYYPHTDASIVKFGDSNANETLSEISMYTPVQDFLSFLNSNDSILLPSGTFILNQPLVASVLKNKKIKGYGKGRTVLKFVGNFNCFDFTDFGYANRFEMSDLTIEVDTTNSNSAIYLFANTSYIKNIKIKNVEIRCKDKAIGLYTGIKLLATNNQGIYKNEFDNIEIYYPNNGIVLRSEATNSGANVGWITFNLFNNPFVEGYSAYGIAIDDDTTVNVQTSDNHFVNPRILDFNNTTTVRTALKLGGVWNTFENLSEFNDGTTGKNYSLELVAPYGSLGGKWNYIKNGHLEGVIKNKQYLFNHNIDTYLIERDNASDTTVSKEKIKYEPSNSDITYYVMNGGNDDNSGLSNDADNALASINGVLKKLPNKIDNNIIIKVADGTYSESVYVTGYNGKGSITIIGNTLTPANVNVVLVSVYQNSIKVIVQGVTATTTSANAFTALYTPAEFVLCTATASTTTYSGLYASYGAIVHVASCTFSNKANAISSKYGAIVTSEVNGGSGNTNNLNASYGGTICKAGSQPGGTIVEATSYGGVIR